MTTTLERIKAHLADESQWRFKFMEATPITDRGFGCCGVRKHFLTSAGQRVSIQQSNSHYCGPGTVELGYCTDPAGILARYFDDYATHSYVPLEKVAEYIDYLEQTPEYTEYREVPKPLEQS